AHEMPAPVQLLALEAEIQMTFLVSGVRVALRIPLAAIPNHDRAGAVFPRRDCSLECIVFDRMIFNMDRKTFLARNQAWAARHRPLARRPQRRSETLCGNSRATSHVVSSRTRSLVSN